MESAVGGDLSGVRDDDADVRRRGPWRQAAERFRRRRLGLAALALLLFIFLVGLLAQALAPYDAGHEFLEFINKPQPVGSPHHILGTDVIGHDFATQLIYGIRESVVSSLVCAAGATLIGAIVGAFAGYYGGVVDALLTWVSSTIFAVPAVAILLIVVIFSKWPVTPTVFGFWLMLYLWPGIARVVRGSFTSLKSREYVEAAHAAGASDLRIIFRHLLPNSIGPLIVGATSLVGQSIIVVATVDFLGLGTVQAEKPTLGSLIADAARGTGFAEAPWFLYVFPAVALVLMLVCVNFIGDTLDDALNPQARRV
jgi:peptide/nickel transport system permease protein